MISYFKWIANSLLAYFLDLFFKRTIPNVTFFSSLHRKWSLISEHKFFHISVLVVFNKWTLTTVCISEAKLKPC